MATLWILLSNPKVVLISTLCDYNSGSGSVLITIAQYSMQLKGNIKLSLKSRQHYRTVCIHLYTNDPLNDNTGVFGKDLPLHFSN